VIANSSQKKKKKITIQNSLAIVKMVNTKHVKKTRGLIGLEELIISMKTGLIKFRLRKIMEI